MKYYFYMCLIFDGIIVTFGEIILQNQKDFINFKRSVLNDNKHENNISGQYFENHERGFNLCFWVFNKFRTKLIMFHTEREREKKTKVICCDLHSHEQISTRVKSFLPILIELVSSVVKLLSFLRSSGIGIVLPRLPAYEVVGAVQVRTFPFSYLQLPHPFNST